MLPPVVREAKEDVSLETPTALGTIASIVRTDGPRHRPQVSASPMWMSPMCVNAGVDGKVLREAASQPDRAGPVVLPILFLKSTC